MMKTAKELMLDYIAANPSAAGLLFAETGSLELPYIASIGIPAVITGPQAITELLTLLHTTIYPGFQFEDVQIHIDTPDQVFAEYHINHRSGVSGKQIHQQFFGHLQAEGGKIKRLREAIDVIVAAEAFFPNGLADVLAKRAADAAPAQP